MFDIAERQIVDARLQIRRGDKVLDVGCGHLPYALATHLADISLTDNSRRFGHPIPINGRPFFECSIESLPFQNAEFDFVYCSHVLEHVKNPAVACAELMRVARRGYIECPRSWTEYVFSAPDHYWLVDLEQNTLVFREKTNAESGDPLGLRYTIFEWLANPDFVHHWNSAEMVSLRTVQLVWEQNFKFVVLTKQARGYGLAGSRFRGVAAPSWRWDRARSPNPLRLLNERRRFLNKSGRTA